LEELRGYRKEFESPFQLIIMKGQLWFMGAGLSILQIIVGNLMIFYGISSLLLSFHVLIPILILLIIVYGYRKVKSGVEKRMLMGNLGLLVITGVLGYFIYSTGNPILSVIHLILALGLVSNFSVLYGLENQQK